MKKTEDNKNTYIPKAGDFISLGGVFFGKCENIYTTENGEKIVKVFLVKNAFQRGASELHELSSPLMGDIRKAELGDLLREVKMRKAALYEKLERLDAV